MNYRIVRHTQPLIVNDNLYESEALKIAQELATTETDEAVSYEVRMDTEICPECKAYLDSNYLLCPECNFGVGQLI